MRYADIKKETGCCPMDGIFFAFSNKQFAEGLARCGYTQEDVDNHRIFSDGIGGYGSKEAFDKRDKYYEDVIQRIKSECEPDEIFRYEFHNYECGYTGDYSEALNIVHEYFPEYEPSQELLDKLMK